MQVLNRDTHGVIQTTLISNGVSQQLTLVTSEALVVEGRTSEFCIRLFLRARFPEHAGIKVKIAAQEEIQNRYNVVLSKLASQSTGEFSLPRYSRSRI